MSKKLIAVLIIALLVVSFAAARVINFQLGPSFSFFKGDTPVSEEPHMTSPYQGYGFGLDTAVDLTFGPKAELYFQDTVNVSTKSAFTKDPTDHEFDTFTLNYKTHAGFEFAVLTDPVKLSVGGGLAFEIVSTIYRYKIEDEDISLVVLDMNMGLGATVKAEFPLANHWSVYVRAFVDYFPVAGFAMGAGGEKDPYSCAGRVNNFSVDASAGIVLYF